MDLNETTIIQFSIRNRKLYSCGYSNYREYLNSDHWKEVKRIWKTKRTKSKFWNECICCKTTKNLLLHHFRYSKINTSVHLSFNNVLPMCFVCHKEAHELVKPSNNLGLKAIVRKHRKQCTRNDIPTKTH